MYKEDSALDRQQWLICHKTQLDQTKTFLYSLDEYSAVSKKIYIYLVDSFIHWYHI